MNTKKLFILLAVIAVAIAFFVFDLGRFFSLTYIKESQQAFSTLYNERPVFITAVFFAIYVAITALSLPGAAIMTLAAGASFGLVWGTVVVSFASTLGATCAMLISRYVLRDSIEKRFGAKLADVNKGMEKEGAFYLFTLRLIPLIPFFMLNVLMGLTKMKTLTFFWVSQLGMLAGTIAYVNAGTEIAKIDSLRSILSPGLVGSFVLLGTQPKFKQSPPILWASTKVTFALTAAPIKAVTNPPAPAPITMRLRSKVLGITLFQRA